jgi:hypothetical protein
VTQSWTCNVERHLGDPAAVFTSQRLAHRGLHYPAETTQAEHVLGQQVVLDEPGVFGAVLCDDREIVVVKQRAALRRFLVV